MAARAGLVVQRARSHRLILSAAFATILLATTLLSAVAIYTGSVADSALHAALVKAAATQTGAEVTGTVETDRAGEQDAAVRTAVAAAYPGVPVEVTASALSSSYGLPRRLGVGEDTLTVFGFYDRLPAHARLTSGSWPAPTGETGSAATGSDAVPSVDAVLPEPAAAELGLSPGDSVRVTNRLSGAPVAVRVLGTYVPRDPGELFWFGRSLETEGRSAGSFTTVGPLVISRDAFFAALPRADATGHWRLAPALDELDAGEMRSVAAGVRALGGQLARQRVFSDAVGETASVTTGLPSVLDRVSRALVVARSTILIPVAQLVLLAGYALLLTARLLSEHRQVETALLRARGSSARQLAGLSLREGVLLGIPAALLGPLLAALVLRAVAEAGPLVNSGITLDPAPRLSTWLVAAAAALGCALAIVLPALRGSSTYVESQQARGRPSRRGVLQRAGADLLLLGVAGLAYWQLRRYRSPVLEDTGGQLGADPLLVVGPALALLALALVALRLLPLLARLAERASGRRTFTPALGTWQLSRRPARYAGPALLLVMALGIGTLSAAYSSSWRRSQDDQAAFRVGADLRVTAPAAVRDTSGLTGEYVDLPGVDIALPLVRERVEIGDEPADLLALDTGEAGGVLTVRDDLLDGRSLGELLKPLRAARPDPPVLALGGRPERLRLTGSLSNGDPDKSNLPPQLSRRLVRQAEVTVAVRDAAGVVRRLNAGPLRGDGAAHRLELDLSPPGSRALAWPLSVVGFSLSYQAPFVQRTLTFMVDSIVPLHGDGAGSPAPRMPAGASWELEVPAGDSLPVAPRVQNVSSAGDALLQAAIRSGEGEPFDRAVQVDATLNGPGRTERALPAVISRRAADASGTGRGELIALNVAGRDLQARVSGITAELPTVAADRGAVLVDLPSLTTLLNRSGEVVAPREFILSTFGDTAPAAAVLRADPSLAADVLDRSALGRELRDDPLAAGVLGALLMSFAAAAAFAAIGFAVNAVVSARERVAEFAVLRALGVAPRQLLGLIGIEQAFLVGLGLLVGLALGAAVATLVVPLVLLTPEATRVVPPVMVTVPWTTVLGLVAALVAVLAAIVMVLARYLRGTALGGTLRVGEDA